MANICMQITVKVSWWVAWYIRACVLFAALTGLQLNADKIAKTTMRGIKVVGSRHG